MTRNRKFKEPHLQAVYDHYRTTKPDPNKTRGQGSAGNGYAVGRLHADPKRPFAVRGSLAYAAWAAGIDNARDDRA